MVYLPILMIDFYGKLLCKYTSPMYSMGYLYIKIGKQFRHLQGQSEFPLSFFHPAEKGDFPVAWLQDVGFSLEMLDVFGCSLLGLT